MGRRVPEAWYRKPWVRGDLNPVNCGAVNEADCMGRYIDDILQPGEKVLYSTNAHWMFYLPAIAAWIVALILLILSRATTTEGIVLLCLAASAVVAIAALYWTT